VLNIRPFETRDLPAILDIAVAAWQPVFASSREIVGKELFALVYSDTDTRKRNQVSQACDRDDPRLVWVAELDGQTAGFITVDLNTESLVGEIGNNAVSPDFQHHGIGTRMYEFVLEQMKNAGMKSAVVETGGDEAHAPARRAYEKAGFAGPVPSVKYHLGL
jgi:ribosomal protein S18 acetylase RimI-like enzyme